MIENKKSDFSPCHAPTVTKALIGAFFRKLFDRVNNRNRTKTALAPASFSSLLAVFVLFLTIAASSTAQAQQPTVSEIAKRVDEHYNSLKSLKTAFQEQYEGLGMRRSESGTMFLRKPGKMRWDYSSTPGKLFVLDGKFAWFYSPGASQVQRIAASQLDDLRSPLRFLLGHTKIESELQNLTLTTSPGSMILSGIPKGQQKRIAKLSLTVTAGGSISAILIQEVDGAETRFNFSNEEPNLAIPESFFHFTPPAGVPVADALPPV